MSTAPAPPQAAPPRDHPRRGRPGRCRHQDGLPGDQRRGQCIAADPRAGRARRRGLNFQPHQGAGTLRRGDRKTLHHRSAPRRRRQPFLRRHQPRRRERWPGDTTPLSSPPASTTTPSASARCRGLHPAAGRRADPHHTTATTTATCSRAGAGHTDRVRRPAPRRAGRRRRGDRQLRGRRAATRTCSAPATAGSRTWATTWPSRPPASDAAASTTPWPPPASTRFTRDDRPADRGRGRGGGPRADAPAPRRPRCSPARTWSPSAPSGPCTSSAGSTVAMIGFDDVMLADLIDPGSDRDGAGSRPDRHPRRRTALRPPGRRHLTRRLDVVPDPTDHPGLGRDPARGVTMSSAASRRRDRGWLIEEGT